METQLCKNCADSKRQTDFYARKCKVLERMLAFYQSKNGEGAQCAEVAPEPEHPIKFETEEVTNDNHELGSEPARPEDDATNMSGNSWGLWQFVVPKIEMPTSDSEDCERQVSDGRNGGEPRQESVGAVDTHMCRWMSEGDPVKMCAKVLENPKGLCVHTVEEHVGSGREGYVCRWHGCAKNSHPFKLRNSLLAHLSTHTGHMMYLCTVNDCRQVFVDAEELGAHAGIHKAKEKPQESVAIRSVIAKQTLAKPRDEGNRCGFPGCNRVFPRKEDLDEHVPRHRTMLMRKKFFECSFAGCRKMFANEAVFKAHQASHAQSNLAEVPEAGPAHPLTGISETASEAAAPPRPGTEVKEPNAPSEKQGAANSRGEPPADPKKSCYVVCRWESENTCATVCGKVLSVEALLTHVRDDHAGPEDPGRHVCMWSACERRDRVFLYKRELVAHVQTHVCSRHFWCLAKNCGQWFSTEEELAGHREAHEVFVAARPEVHCSFTGCDKKFWYKSRLRKHVLAKHSGKRFRCPNRACQMRFKTKERMTEHNLRVHEGKPRYVCAEESCGRVFNCGNHLKRHVRLLHLLEKPFRCTVPGCGKEFAYPTTYETHRKSHAKEPPQ